MHEYYSASHDIQAKCLMLQNQLVKDDTYLCVLTVGIICIPTLY